MKVLFIAGFAPISREVEVSQRFYRETLGLDFEGGEGDYRFTEKLGVRHFAVWPLREAARTCFDRDEWPSDVPVPQATVEFEVADVEAAAAELRQGGFQLIHGARTEPWTQVTARLLSPEGLLVAVCYTPGLHPPVVTPES